MSLNHMYGAVELATEEIMAQYDEIVYMDDVIMEYATELVPTYYSDTIDQWKSVDDFDSPNYEGEHDIIAQMERVLLDWYIEHLAESVAEAVEKLEVGE